MDKKLVSAFCNAKYEAEAPLAESCWHVVEKSQKHNALIKLWVFSLVGLSAIIALIPVLTMLVNDFRQSGFYEYFSLIFTGGVLSNWKELLLILGESLPVVSIILFLSLVFILFLSSRHLLKQLLKQTNPLFVNKLLSI